VPQSEFFSGAYSGPDTHELAVGYWTAVTAGILYINWRPSTAADPNYSNSAFYDDDTLAGFILDGNSEPDAGTANADYEKAQNYIADHALAIGVYDRLSTLAVSPKLKDVWQEHAQGGPTFYDAYFVN
jgi:peptide/nickel transport system substrate-binding protein